MTETKRKKHRNSNLKSHKKHTHKSHSPKHYHHKKKGEGKSEKSSLSEPLLENTPYTASDEAPSLQEEKCRDAIAILLFLGVLSFFIYVAVTFGPAAISEGLHSKTDPHNYTGYFYATATLAVASFVSSTILTKFLLKSSEYVITGFLFFGIGIGLIMTQSTSESNNLSLYGYIVMAVVGAYTVIVWKRIPFATSNIVTAMECLDENFGIIYIGYFYVIFLLVWTILWLLALDAANETTKICDNQGKECRTQYLIFVPFIMVYLWVYQVVVNTAIATSAGLLQIWWTDPDEASDCVSSAVTKPFRRILIYSVGSICYGSLLSPYVQGLNDLINPDGDLSTGITVYFPTKCVQLFEKAVSHFTQWAYVYCGMYGYKFSECGPKVRRLFANKNWWPIASDNLVKNIFFLCSLSIGYVCAQFALILESNTNWFDDAKESSALYASVLGFTVGILFSSILLALVLGAYLAVIVLFAENPEDLEEYHQDLYQNMKDRYKKVFPTVDIGSPYDSSVV